MMCGFNELVNKIIVEINTIGKNFTFEEIDPRNVESVESHLNDDFLKLNINVYMRVQKKLK